MATAKRDDVVYGNVDTLLVVREYERLIDKGAGLSHAQFACALWCVYALRSAPTQNGDRFASWGDLANGRWSNQGRLIFPAINLGRTAMRTAFRALEAVGYIRATHRTREPSIFRMPTEQGALEAFSRTRAANDAAATPEPALNDSHSDPEVRRFEPCRALHDLRHERPTVWLRRVWSAAVQLRDRSRLQHTMLADHETQWEGCGLIDYLWGNGIRRELDQRRFLFFAASRSRDPQWYRIENLLLIDTIDPLIDQYREECTSQPAAA